MSFIGPEKDDLYKRILEPLIVVFPKKGASAAVKQWEKCHFLALSSSDFSELKSHNFFTHCVDGGRVEG